MTEKQTEGHVVDIDRLPSKFPTHRHECTFWESLGRAVATFGFLEEILAKAIFAFTATRPYAEDDIQEAYAKWRPKLEHALKDPLGNLIDAYGEAVRDHGGSAIRDVDSLLADLRKVSAMRNILCHGSWRLPDASGASVPFFVSRKLEVVDTAMDCQYIDQVQRHTAELACVVINTVTAMGWQFPGSMGPGKPIWQGNK
jgi:hypothetical protein